MRSNERDSPAVALLRLRRLLTQAREALAREYGVVDSTINLIVRRITYRDGNLRGPSHQIAVAA